MEYILDSVSDVSDSEILQYDAEKFIREDTGHLEDQNEAEEEARDEKDCLDIHPDQEDLRAICLEENVEKKVESDFRSNDNNLKSKSSSSSTPSTASLPKLSRKANFSSSPKNINIVRPRIMNNHNLQRHITRKWRTQNRRFTPRSRKYRINQLLQQQYQYRPQSYREQYSPSPRDEEIQHSHRQHQRPCKRKRVHRHNYPKQPDNHNRIGGDSAYCRLSNPVLLKGNNKPSQKSHKVELKPVLPKKRYFTLKYSENMNTVNILLGGRGDINHTTPVCFEEGELDERDCAVPYLPKGSRLIPPMMNNSEEWYKRFGHWLEPEYCDWRAESARPPLPVLVDCYKEDFDVDLRRGRSIFSLPTDAVYDVDTALSDYFYEMMNGNPKYLAYMATLAGKRLGCDSETATVGVHLIHYFVNNISNASVKWFKLNNPDVDVFFN